MLNENRVKKMSQLAILEQQMGLEPFQMYKFSKLDYIRWELMKTWISVTIAYGICCIGIIGIKLEYILDHWLELDYVKIAIWGLIGYGVLLIISLVGTIKISKSKFEGIEKNMKCYVRLVEEICECYETEKGVMEE